MYIIVIGWLYIIVLMAATEKTLVAGVMTLVFYGLAPTALFWWLFGRPRKRPRMGASAGAEAGLDEVVRSVDRQGAEQD